MNISPINRYNNYKRPNFGNAKQELKNKIKQTALPVVLATAALPMVSSCIDKQARIEKEHLEQYDRYFNNNGNFPQYDYDHCDCKTCDSIRTVHPEIEHYCVHDEYENKRLDALRERGYNVDSILEARQKQKELELIEQAKYEQKHKQDMENFNVAALQGIGFFSNGEFNKVDMKYNGLIINDTYNLFEVAPNHYTGAYSVEEDHCLYLSHLKNGNFNLVYRRGEEEPEVVAFSKDGRALSFFNAVKQNSNGGEIKRFKNRMSEKEYSLMKRILSSEFKTKDIRYKNGKISVAGVGTFENDKNISIKYDNGGGRFTHESKRIAIEPAEAGCYKAMREYERATYPTKYEVITYLDGNYNVISKATYRAKLEKHDKLQRELEQKYMKEAIQVVKTGKPVVVKQEDKFIIILPTPDGYVHGETDLSVQIANALKPYGISNDKAVKWLKEHPEVVGLTFAGAAYVAVGIEDILYAGIAAAL